MANDILHSVSENFQSFLNKIGDLTLNLIKKDPENKVMMSHLCASLPWFALECQKNKMINHTKVSLNKLVNDYRKS